MIKAYINDNNKFEIMTKEIKLLLVVLLFSFGAFAQEKDLDYTNYKIEDKILLDGINECMNLNKDSDNLANAVIVIVVNISGDTTRYLIHYAYSSFTFEFNPPREISKIGDELVYFSYCGKKGSPLKKDILYKITEEQFPEEYEFNKIKEKNELKLSNSIDGDYSVLLTVKDDKLQQKNIYSSAYDICGVQK